MNNLFKYKKIIAATRSDAEFLAACKSDAEIIFDLDSDIMTLPKKLKKANEFNKKVFVHIDLAEGIGKDKSGITFLKKMGVHGIISTKNNIIKLAREACLCTVQRFFIVDSKSIQTTVESTRSSRPDMIEIMPAIVGKVISGLSRELSVPIIAGGLIETDEEVSAVLGCGATAVSTGQITLWNGNSKQ